MDEATQPAVPQVPVSSGARGSPDYSLLDAAREKGVKFSAELEAALAERDRRQESVDFRSRWMSVARGAEAGLATRKQLMDETNEPIRDVLRRAGMHDVAVKQAVEEGNLAATDFQSKQLAEDMDPTHPKSRAAVKLAEKHLPGFANLPQDVRNGMSLHTLERLGSPGKMIADQAKTLGEAEEKRAGAGKARAETGEVAATARAERALKYGQAEEVRAKAAQVAPGATAEQALKYGQAEEARAKAGVEWQKVGGEIYPGVSRGSQPLSDKQVEETNTKLRSTDELLDGLDRVQELLGSHRAAVTPQTRGRVETELNQLTAKMMQSDQFKRLTEVDKDFFGPSFFGNPNNLTNLATDKSRAKLDEARRALSREASSHIRGHGLRTSEEVRKRYEKGSNSAEKSVRMRAPDGSIHDVAESKVPAAIAAKGKVL